MNVGWEPPRYEVREFHPKQTRYCVCIPVHNEGDRIRGQLQRMKAHAGLADIVICDGRSTDGSVEPEFLGEMGVRTLLVTDERGLCTATRMGIAYAMEEGYDGVVTVDGNGKDGIEALPRFLKLLEEGCDLVQGSRFMKGGEHANTPVERQFAIRYIFAPLIALGGGFWFTDPTNAFRAMSMNFLGDSRVQPIRHVFVRFNLQMYFLYRAAKLGFRIEEIPVVRNYPEDGTIPTKIRSWRTKMLIVWELLKTVFGFYNPRG